MSKRADGTYCSPTAPPLAEAGLPVLPEWLASGNYSVRSGLEAGRQLMALEERPTALFVANDQMAMGVLEALRVAGVRCPEDISVFGFDDITIAEHLSPPLTTMRQPCQQIGRLATQILIDILEGRPPHDPLRVELRAELVVRASTAPPSRC